MIDSLSIFSFSKKHQKNIRLRVRFFLLACLVVAANIISIVSPAHAGVDESCDPTVIQKLITNPTASDTSLVESSFVNGFNGTASISHQHGGLDADFTDGFVYLDSNSSWDNLYTGVGTLPQPASGSLSFASADFDPSDKAVVRYNKAATYENESVDIIATYSGFRNSPDGDPQPGVITVSERFQSGIYLFHTDQVDVEYKIVKSGTDEAIIMDDNAYIAIGSLNFFDGGREYVASGANINPHATTATDTAIMLGTTNNTGIEAYIGIDSTSPYVDKIGDPTFPLRAVQFQILGNNFVLRYGTEKQSSSIWVAPLTAMINPVPCASQPVKSVNQSSISANTETSVTYEISQATQSLGTELLTQYNDFAIIDTLDPRVNVNASDITVKLGDTDSTADFTITLEGHTLTVTPNQALLANPSFYGTIITITVPTTINSDSLSSVKNFADAIINGHKKASNLVETIITPKSPSTGTLLLRQNRAVIILSAIAVVSTLIYIIRRIKRSRA